MTNEKRDARTRFDKDVAWSAFAMLVPIAVGFAALPILYKNVDQQAFTLFLLFYGAISFAPGLDLGVARTAQRRIAYATLLHSETQTALVRHSLRQATFVSIVAGILAAIGATFLFPHQGGEARIGLSLVTGIGVGLAIYANCQRGVLEGLGAFSRSALNRAGVGVMLIGAPVISSFFTRDAAILSIAALMTRIPFIWEQQRAIRVVMTPKQIDEDRPREEMVAGFMRESGWFALLSALAVAMSGFDRYILIGWGGLSGQSLASFLATQDLALRAIAIPSALLPALTVRLAAGKDHGITRALSGRLFLAIVPGAVIACIVGALLSEQVILILYPRLPVETTAFTLDVLLFGVAASAIAQFPMARLVASGRARDAALMHLAEFALYLSVAPLLVQRFGATGAAALWSGRIVIDTAVLIIWSEFIHRERSATLREASALIIGFLLILLTVSLV
jgi:O-antigen/teichoic acid export membrane protein